MKLGDVVTRDLVWFVLLPQTVVTPLGSGLGTTAPAAAVVTTQNPALNSELYGHNDHWSDDSEGNAGDMEWTK